MDAMKEVGDKMDASLRETALGGLARTEEGVKIAEKMLHHRKIGDKRLKNLIIG